MKNSRLTILNILPYILFSILVIATSNLSFFWDTTQLASKHAHFFYENNFKTIILPNSMDSGHIPTFGIYIAFLWKLFGKSLLVSHLAMLPFVLGTVFFTQQLVKKLLNSDWIQTVTILLLCDAAILAQFTLVSPDVWIICFLTMALYSIFTDKRRLLALAFTGLILTSMRGMMCVAGLFFAELLISLFCSHIKYTVKELISTGIKFIIKSIPIYAPATAIAITFMSWHYLKTGWIGYHPDMPWYSSFEPVNFQGFLRNVIILIWRFMDNGRVFIWVIAFFVAWHMIHFKMKPDATGKKLLIITGCLFLLLSQNALFRKGLSLHRYMIPLFYMVSITIYYHIVTFIDNKKLLRFTFITLFIGLLSGNFWVYPEKIASGWDAMLSYLPYQKLRPEMINYINQNNIPIDQVITAFPNHVSTKYIDLSNNPILFKDYADCMNQSTYFFYSNTFSGMSDEEIDELYNNWIKIKEFSSLQVKVILFKKPNSK